MKVMKETLFERIRNRFEPAEAAEIIEALLRATEREEIGHRSVVEASEMVERIKLEARCAIRAYRVWRTHQVVREMHRATYDQEGRYLRDAARNLSSLYLDVRRDYQDLVALSIAKHQDEPANDA